MFNIQENPGTEKIWGYWFRQINATAIAVDMTLLLNHKKLKDVCMEDNEKDMQYVWQFYLE